MLVQAGEEILDRQGHAPVLDARMGAEQAVDAALQGHALDGMVESLAVQVKGHGFIDVARVRGKFGLRGQR